MDSRLMLAVSSWTSSAGAPSRDGLPAGSAAASEAPASAEGLRITPFLAEMKSQPKFQRRRNAPSIKTAMQIQGNPEKMGAEGLVRSAIDAAELSHLLAKQEVPRPPLEIALYAAKKIR
jgi:hypothetical protein